MTRIRLAAPAPWKGAHQRRTLLYKYCQSHLAWSARRVRPDASLPLTPRQQRVAASARIAGLRGRNLELVEHRVLKRLAQAGVKPQSGLNGRKCGYVVTEDVALSLGLLFRTLAPMRSRDNMGREEAAYWLGMAMYRRHPRRVLTALRFLLTEPRRRAAG